MAVTKATTTRGMKVSLETETWCSERWCWRRGLRVPWTARRSNQSILKKISPEYSLEGLMLKLKFQYFGHLMRTDSFEKTLMLGNIEREENGMTEDEMVGWHHWLNGHGFGWTPGVGDGQGGLACCSPWGRKESDTTERLNWTELRNREGGKDSKLIKAATARHKHVGSHLGVCLLIHYCRKFQKALESMESLSGTTLSIGWKKGFELC